MRRYLAIITLSVTLLAMHGGKWAAYAWCQVQASLAQQQACDCARVLTADDGNSQLAHNNGVIINLVSELFGTAGSSSAPAQLMCETAAGSTACLSFLTSGVCSLVFRPPAQYLLA
ncbi:MAG: hypothetical protein MUF62_01905 [Chitinophagaceae bacterium]|nr:hypothetical protein [Chitinophagaceae bacterium]